MPAATSGRLGIRPHSTRRYDFITPPLQQAELFKLFGTPDADKRLIFDGGHVPPRIDMIRAILDFLDERLGPIKK